MGAESSRPTKKAPSLMDRIRQGPVTEEHIVYDGLSLSQLQELYAKVEDFYGKERAATVTVREVVRDIVIPLCRKHGFKRSYARIMNMKKLLRAEIFVSHCWDEPVLPFVVALASATSHMKNPIFWICALALIQGSDDVVADQLQGNILHLPFAGALSECKLFIVVRNAKVDVLSRGWCVFELCLALQLGHGGVMLIAGPDTFKDKRGTCLDSSTTVEADRRKIFRFLFEQDEEFLTELNQRMVYVRAREDLDFDVRQVKRAALIAATSASSVAVSPAVRQDPAVEKWARFIEENKEEASDDFQRVYGAKVELVIQGNAEVGQECAEFGAAVLNSNVDALRLMDCNLGDQGAAALATSPHLRNLARLDLEYNNIGDEGANALAKAQFQKLETLWLRDNSISDEAQAMLRERFGHIETLIL